MHEGVRFIACLAILVLAAGCSGGSQQSALVPGTSPINRALTSAASAPNAVPCYFNGQLVSIFLTPLSPTAAQQVLAQNKNVNLIFIFVGTNFIPVINEIQGPVNTIPRSGFNPLWQEIDVTFKSPPGTQLKSVSDINAAKTASLITLTPTQNVLTVPVIGPTGK